MVGLVGAYLVSTYLHEARQRLLRETGEAAPVEALVGGGIGAVLARRRIYPMPTSVDVEHTVLFVTPIVAAVGLDVVAGVFVAAAVFYGLQALRYLLGLLRTARRIDRPDGQ